MGGGYIGLEIAAIAVKLGAHVTVIETAARVLARVASPELSAFYERVHREHGVEIRTNSSVQALEGDDRAARVALSDGTRLAADVIVIGIGLVPNVELARNERECDADHVRRCTDARE